MNSLDGLEYEFSIALKRDGHVFVMFFNARFRFSELKTFLASISKTHRFRCIHLLACGSNVFVLDRAGRSMRSVFAIFYLNRLLSEMFLNISPVICS